MGTIKEVWVVLKYKGDQIHNEEKIFKFERWAHNAIYRHYIIFKYTLKLHYPSIIQLKKKEKNTDTIFEQ